MELYNLELHDTICMTLTCIIMISGGLWSLIVVRSRKRFSYSLLFIRETLSVPLIVERDQNLPENHNDTLHFWNNWFGPFETSDRNRNLYLKDLNHFQIWSLYPCVLIRDYSVFEIILTFLQKNIKNLTLTWLWLDLF